MVKIMGKWAEVNCCCPNRRPLPDSDLMFECGHRRGVVIELSPHDIIHVGNLISRVFKEESEAFEIFTRVGDWRNYEDELLPISPDESRMWLLEIEEIQNALEGFGNLPYKLVNKLVQEYLREDLGSRIELENQLDEVAAKMPFAPVVSLKQNVEQDERPTPESSMLRLRKVLDDATRLCNAGIETGNPIRLLW